MPDLTIVSAASSNHSAALHRLLRSIELCRARARTIVYDLGLTDAEASTVRRHCSELRRFDFTAFPAYFDISVEGGQYAWKPIIVSEVAAERPGLLLWLDAGSLVFGDLSAIECILLEQGFYSPVSPGYIVDWTHPATLRCLRAPPVLLRKRNRNGAVVGFDTGRAEVMELIAAWRRCALDRECIAPLGSSRRNHRQDQAVLSVLAYQFQARVGYRLIDEKIDVSTHNDRLRDERLERHLRMLRRTEPLRRLVFPLEGVLQSVRRALRW